jgi:small subunit ribosomal protein S1
VGYPTGAAGRAPPPGQGPGRDCDFASLLAEYESSEGRAGRGPEEGSTVTGTVISIGDDVLFVDLGGKSEGMLGLDQVRDRDGQLQVQVGDRIEARVVETGGESGVVVLRRSLGKGPEAAAELQQAFDHQIPVEGLVAGTNKGGFEVQVAGVRAFCPISQIDNRFVEVPEQFVGQRLQFRITKIDTGRGRPDIVLSRRALLEEEAAERAAEVREHLEVGVVLRGTISSLKDYGAFVDLGGLEGLLHVSELGHARVGHPSEVVNVGDSVEVQVIKIEPSPKQGRSEKISLSLKALERDPWDDVAGRFAPGSVIPGQVVRIQPFGAFVEIASGIEGLIHISELAADKRINNPREVVEVGQRIEVTVLSVDAENRRISLSLAAAERDSSAAAEAANIREHAPRSQSLGTFADLLGAAGVKSDD